MNGVQTRFKCKLDVKRCKRFVFPPSSLLPRSNALKTKAIRYFQTDRTLTRIVSPPLNSGKKKFYTQHSTWIKTQYYSLFTNIGNLPGAILSGKFDYADRILQWFIFPRTILLGILLLFSFLSVYFHWSACLKWWGLLLTFLLTMAIATPNYLVDSKFNKAMKAIPFLAAGMIFNMLLRKKK